MYEKYTFYDEYRIMKDFGFDKWRDVIRLDDQDELIDIRMRIIKNRRMNKQ